MNPDRLASFCKRMEEDKTPFGTPRVETIGEHEIQATKSRTKRERRYQKGGWIEMKPDPKSVCEIDNSVEIGLQGKRTGLDGICDHCLRRVKVRINKIEQN